MSSILKALKRIEGQGPPAQSFPGLPDSVDAKRAVNSNARRRWRKRRLIALSLVMITLAAAAVVAYQNRQYLTAKFRQVWSASQNAIPEPGGESNPRTFRAKIYPPSPKPANKRPAPIRQPRRPLKKVVPGSTPQGSTAELRISTAGRKVRRPKSRTTPAMSSKKPPGVTLGNRAIPKPASRQRLTPSKKSIAGKRRKTANPAARTPESDRAKTYAKLTDSQIKLQALAWSRDAAKRMAVINGRIVREGESFDGYQITRIRPEDVIVSDSRQTWSLKFGLKQ